MNRKSRIVRNGQLASLLRRMAEDRRAGTAAELVPVIILAAQAAKTIKKSSRLVRLAAQ